MLKAYNLCLSKKKMMIFLDFDNVLNSDYEFEIKYKFTDSRTEYSFPFQTKLTEVFCQFMDEFPESEIVICSTWRNSYSNEYSKSNSIGLHEFDKKSQSLLRNLEEHKEKSLEFIHKLINESGNYFRYAPNIVGVTPDIHGRFSEYIEKRTEIEKYIEFCVENPDDYLFIIIDDHSPDSMIPDIANKYPFIHVMPWKNAEGKYMGFRKSLSDALVSFLKGNYNMNNPFYELRIAMNYMFDTYTIHYLPNKTDYKSLPPDFRD
jgi:hypothetical protein